MRLQKCLLGFLWVITFCLFVYTPEVLPEGERDLSVTPRMEMEQVAIEGEYWALLIGINQYQHVPHLETAVQDATAVRDVLVERYGFAPERISTLLDEHATQSEIENSLYNLGRLVKPEDSLFIYYAGHGQYEDDGQLGWWVPVGAVANNPGTFITNASIRDYIRSMKARHVYLVADSCFSGTLFGTRALPPINDQWIANLYRKPSRWGLTSGNTEPVADRGKNGHSVFANHFLTLLRENTEPYLVPSHIYDYLAPLVANNSAQTPRSEPLSMAGDEGGQFVFQLTTGGNSLMTGSESQEALAKAKQELKALEELETQMAEQNRLKELQAQIEEKKKTFAMAKTHTPQTMPFPQRHDGEVKENIDLFALREQEFRKKQEQEKARLEEERQKLQMEREQLNREKQTRIEDQHALGRSSVEDLTRALLDKAFLEKMKELNGVFQGGVAKAHPRYSLPPTIGQSESPKPFMNSSDPSMVLIKNGFLNRGGQSPPYKISIDAFLIDQHEVTNQNFRQFVDATGYKTTAERQGKSWGYSTNGDPGEIPGATWRNPEGMSFQPPADWDKHPVVMVSWYDAEAFCQWKKKRLPTEAEWEYATQAGESRLYGWGNVATEKSENQIGNLADQYLAMIFPGKISTMEYYYDGFARTAPVGSFRPNAWQLYDMIGNVWEWTAEDSDRDSQSTDIYHTTEPETSVSKVYRGGAWNEIMGDVMISTRREGPPSLTSSVIGFRCAKNAK